MEQIVKAMLAAYEECGYVQKSHKNSHFDYKYASEVDFLEKVRPALLKNGVIVYPSNVKVVSHGVERTVAQYKDTKKDELHYRVVTEYEFTFAHSSGQSIKVCAVGEGVDKGGDKSSYKAATGALKYALRQAMLIETGDDPEKDEQTRPTVVAPITEEEADLLSLALGSPDRVKKFCGHYDIDNLLQLPGDKFELALKQIEQSNKKKVG